MQRSKSLALMFLLGALVVGGALGFSADRLFSHDMQCTSSGERGSMRKRLATTLALTPAQEQAVDSILDKRHRDFMDVIRPVRPQLDSVRERARVDIAKLLDAEQRARFQWLIEESNDERARKEARER